MKSQILVSRLIRVIETDGQVGDGAALADAFADAARAVNARMEAVLAAESAKQVSDAVRLMEEPPRLLDEIRTLDFFSVRLPKWIALCERNGWQKPVAFDKSLVERMFMLSGSKSVVEPFLKMYRKAMRTNNNALAVKALQRLVDVDGTRNWDNDLIQAETALQREMGEAFVAAESRGDADALEKIAREFALTTWRATPSGRAVAAIQSYWACREARRREAEGAENLSLLRRCLDEGWNGALALSMINAIDKLVDEGYRLPDDAQGLVDECRKRVEQEKEEREKDLRYKARCEELHGAIQLDDAAAIRTTLAAPEFLDQEPPDEMLHDAQRVLVHEEAERRRKTMTIAVTSLLALSAVLGMSGWWLKQKLFSVRCENEAARLASLEKGGRAIDRLGEALRSLRAQEPHVLADPRVSVFEGRLKTMAAKNLARTNELAGILAELDMARAGEWSDSTGSATGLITRAESLLTAEDVEYRTRWARLKDAYGEHLSAVADMRRTMAAQRHKALIARIKDLSARLSKIVGGDEQDSAVSACKADIAEWRAACKDAAPELHDALAENERELASAERRQKDVRDALDLLRTAPTAPKILDARKALYEFHSGFQAVKDMARNPVDASAARKILEGTSAQQKSFAALGETGITKDAFKKFLAENVASLSEIPSFYSLYGLMVQNPRNEFFAVAKGRPDIKRLNNGKAWQITGKMIDFKKRGTVDKTEQKSPISGYEIPSVDEVRTFVDLASDAGLTAGQFENEILKRVEEHLQTVFQRDENKKRIYIESERKYAALRHLTRGRYPAIRRVQMLDIYFRWLKNEIKTMPADAYLLRCCEKAERLAQPIKVEGVPDDLSWVCLWEKRIRDRNNECIDFLDKFPEDWGRRYKAWRKVRFIVRDVARWKVETAGRLLFDPRNVSLRKDPDAIIPVVPRSVAADHPLYVLRYETDGQLRLHKALVPRGGKWARMPDVVMLPGEPLYQVCRDGRVVDAEAELVKVVKDIPADIRKSVVRHIPLFAIKLGP